MSTRRTVSVRSRLAASAAVIALGATACGSDSGGASAESWCDFASESDVVDEVLSALGADPGETEAGLKQVEDIVKRLPKEAPDEISDAAEVLADGTQQMVDAFKDADFNIADVDLSFTTDAELEADLDAAGEELDAYTQKECGRSFGDDSISGDDSGDSGDDSISGDDSNSGDDSDEGDFDPANGTLRDQLVAQFESIGLTNDESSCIAENLDFSDPAVQSGDIGAMLNVFEECGIGIDRLTELSGG